MRQKFTGYEMDGKSGSSDKNVFIQQLVAPSFGYHPESGIINYVYDNNSNLTQKTDARLVVTNYVYDALNRVTQRNYTAPGGLANYQATPNVSYFYDGVNVAGGIANSKGKLTKVTNGTGVDRSTTEYVTFDILGRVTRSKQTTDGVVYGTDAAPMTYTYNLSGAMIEQKYPSGRVVKNVLDADGDLAQVQSQKNATAIWRNYANSFVYTAAGAVSSVRLGNGKFENTTFNSRLQPIQIGLGGSASTQNLLKLNYDYGTTDNNGNVKSQTITVPTVGASAGFVATQTYTYDSLNRINDAKEMIDTTQTWKQTFLYDRYGNRNFDTTLNRTTTILSDAQLPCAIRRSILQQTNLSAINSTMPETQKSMPTARLSFTTPKTNRSKCEPLQMFLSASTFTTATVSE